MRRNAHSNPGRLERATAEHVLIIDAILAGSHVGYAREERLTPRDRIDFLVGETGIEVKIKPSGVRRPFRRRDDQLSTANALPSRKPNSRPTTATAKVRPAGSA